ncbi:hypothetical protein [Aestuariibius sp. HNIBRBA575]|uniref:hypothetical protein n=1 Tax=Aestuariibius sp. HNIBRBA575 TaxID=3233343 RepID=UPI0034A27163
MPSMSIKDAAILAEASYSPSGINSPRILHSCPDADVQGHFLDGDILLLPGSNSIRDYIRFNLRVLNLGNVKLALSGDKTEKGTSGTTWHQGFLSYSRVLTTWLSGLNKKPKLIIGHSLGAASAQILCRTYGAPAICFAAPRPKFIKGAVKHDEKLLIINRSDDLVPGMPPSFSHMGKIHLLSPAKKRRFPAHAMKHYRSILNETTSLPTRWG